MEQLICYVDGCITLLLFNSKSFGRVRVPWAWVRVQKICTRVRL